MAVEPSDLHQVKRQCTWWYSCLPEYLAFNLSEFRGLFRGRSNPPSVLSPLKADVREVDCRLARCFDSECAICKY